MKGQIRKEFGRRRRWTEELTLGAELLRDLHERGGDVRGTVARVPFELHRRFAAAVLHDEDVEWIYCLELCLYEGKVEYCGVRASL